MMNCKQCQSRLAAYLHNELPPKLRREVGRHLHNCEKCYAVYLQHQDLARELTNTVPLVGAGYQPDFNRVWTAMQAGTPRRNLSNHLSFNYGLVALVVTLLFLVPLTMNQQNATLAAPPTQPAPLAVRQAPDSTAPSAEGTAVALQLTTAESTPEAGQRTVAPSLDVANTP